MGFNSGFKGLIYEYCLSGSVLRAEVLLSIFWVVLLYNAISEYHVDVAVGTAVKALDVA